jgi:hypothetical protein
VKGEAKKVARKLLLNSAKGINVEISDGLGKREQSAVESIIFVLLIKSLFFTWKGILSG